MYTSLWGYTNNLFCEAQIITQIKSAGGKIYFSNTRNLMDDMAGSADWERIQYIDALPAKILPNDSIYIYAACAKDSVYIDDIGIQFGTKR